MAYSGRVTLIGDQDQGRIQKFFEGDFEFFFLYGWENLRKF